MAGITNQDRQKVRERLLKKLKQFKEDIAYLEEATKPIPPENAIGRVSRMDAINNKSIALASLSKIRRKQRDYLEAMENINDESFGECQKCHQPISTERMMMMPNSKVCMDCIRNA